MATDAPDELELIRGFVNTYDPNDGTDVIADPAGLERWLAGHGFAVPEVDDQAVATAARFREALRAILLAHHAGGAPPAEAVQAVNEVAGGAGLTVGFDASGVPDLRPVAGSLGGVLAALLAVAYRAAMAGTWQRLKVCPADDCLWAFYDHSRNRSRTWCSMQACGNRAKARAYRERHG